MTKKLFPQKVSKRKDLDMIGRGLDLQILLLQRTFRIRQLNIKMPQKGRNHLGHFHKRDILTKTHSIRATESQEIPLHFSFIALDPALGVEFCSVVAVDGGVAVDDPC